MRTSLFEVPNFSYTWFSHTTYVYVSQFLTGLCTIAFFFDFKGTLLRNGVFSNFVIRENKLGWVGQVDSYPT